MRWLCQPLCSTSPLLASNYVSGHFTMKPICGMVGGISVTSHSFKSFCDALRKNAALASVARPGHHGTSRGAQRRVSTQRWWIPAHSLLSSLPRQALPSGAAAELRQRHWRCHWSQHAPRTVPPPHRRFPVSCAFNRSRGMLQWATVQITSSPCNWIFLQVPFWLSVWNQNSVAKYYFFFM